ncbi:MAG: hypothetical protein EA409_04695 [Saprospirales bacterium]|nr:MAG: hypothetical protein EA409_04695 [Saprospirales bacterium]
MKSGISIFSRLFFLPLVCLLMPGFGLVAQNYSAGSAQLTFVDADRNNRSISTQVYYPADQPGNNVAVSEGSFHHIVFGHGFVMAVSAYESIATSLAEQGFIVLLPETEGGFLPSHSNFAQDLAFVAEHFLDLNEQQSSIFYEKIAGRFAMGGHSMGGGCTYLSLQYMDGTPACLFTFAAAETNPSAIDQLSNFTVPNLFFSAELDCVTPPQDHQIPMYEAQSGGSCKYLIEISGGYHCQFNDFNFNCNFGESTCSPGGGIEREEQIELTLELLVPWLRAWLEKDCISFEEFEILVDNQQGFSAEFECQISPLGEPMIEIAGDMPVCPGETLLLVAMDTQGDILWSTGESSEEIEISVPGFYSYSLSNEVCTVVSSDVEIEFQDPIIPEIIVEGSTELCPGESVILQTDHPMGTLEWSNGSMESAIQISEEGAFSYILEVNGCQFISEEVMVTLIGDPGFKVLSPAGSVLCPGDFLELVNSQGLNEVLWNTEEFESSILVSEGGPFYYEGEWLGCTFQSDTLVVSVDDPGKIDLLSSAASPLCPADSLTLTADFEGSILWSNGATGAEITVSVAGNYYFEAYTDFCVYSSDTFRLEVVAEIFPKVGIKGIPLLCNGDTLLLIAEREDAHWNTGAIDSVLWVDEPGLYFYSLVDSACVFYSDTMVVEGIEIAEIEIFSSNPQGICPGGSIVLSHSLGEAMVFWSTGDSASNIEVTSPGFYYFTAGDSICEFQSDTFEVVEIVDPLASISHEGKTELCPGEFTTLIADGIFDAILWNIGDSSASIDVDRTGIYFFEYILNGCSFSSDSLVIDKLQKPDYSVAIEGDSINCPGEHVWLIVNIEKGRVQWSNETAADSLMILETGTYSFSIELLDCLFPGDSIFIEFGQLYSGAGIIGPDTVEAGSTHFYEIEWHQGLQYEWVAEDAIVVAGQMDSSVEVFFPEEKLGSIEIGVFINDGICIDTMIGKAVLVEMPVGVNELPPEGPIWKSGPESWKAVFDDERQFSRISVFDIAGRKLNHWGKVSGTEITIPHYQLPSGLYLIVLKDSRGYIFTEKLIKP